MYTTAKINGRTVAQISNLSQIEALYSRLSEGEAIYIYQGDDEIERHIRINGEVVGQEWGVDYDESDKE